ncbi:MAG: diaminopimelate epimerase [Gammaproteobacteria bacterium]|nr:diaminopimelate epimerase [Gammaproteobacteria bacterium]
MRYPFTKMQSLGNDFVVLNGVSNTIVMSKALAEKLADRHFGIGCDQILLAQNADHNKSGFRYRIFNRDGSEVGQCGNGARCFARFLVDEGLTTDRVIPVYTSTTSMMLCLNDDDTVTVDMGKPVFMPSDIPFDAPKASTRYSLQTDLGIIEIASLAVGNPHSVCVVDNVENADVENLGPIIECHERFPERVNVGFMEVLSRNHIRLRVHERGAGETLGCGSGASAAVVSGILMGMLDSEVTVSLPGGDSKVRWNGVDSKSGVRHSIYLTGSAETVFKGTIELSG